MTADHIGIIANGVLGYQDRIHQDEDLEKLFTDVVMRYRGGE